MGARTIHEVATLAGARARALATGPRDLAILDLELPDGDGIGLITELRRRGWPRIVVLTSTDDPDTAHAALQAGAQAYLLKPGSLPITIDNPRPVSEGDLYADRTIMPAIAIATQVSTPYHNAHQLTARQLQVLQLVADGQSNKEIGRALNLSPLTVKTHLSHIGAKLGLSDRVQMVAQAIRAGLIH
ncbi:MAG TPA: response regulator transcription factor [Actinophytocola sp.]|uniref:response regulator transcription factor n=1 Tax=Actinophytocola sp. TaxID=1872138 RepID=UPI002DDD57B0|nr:response regulator transcription factor [Actinophytocola sp.]HEV2778246.1 response regulator transcription factor [Actinophytocola sp.]